MEQQPPFKQASSMYHNIKADRYASAAAAAE